MILDRYVILKNSDLAVAPNMRYILGIFWDLSWTFQLCAHVL